MKENIFYILSVLVIYCAIVILFLVCVRRYFDKVPHKCLNIVIGFAIFHKYFCMYCRNYFILYFKIYLYFVSVINGVTFLKLNKIFVSFLVCLIFFCFLRIENLVRLSWCRGTTS